MKRKFNLKVLLLLSSGHMVVDIYQAALPSILPFIKDNLNLSYTLAGVVLIVANLTSSIIQPIFGLLSDKKEKAFLLPLGVLLAGAGFSLLPVTSNFGMVLFLVMISGLGVASYHPEGFKTARFFTGEKMATGMSVFSVGGNMGMALGPIAALSIVNYLGFPSLILMAAPAFVFFIIIILLRRTIAIPESSKTGGPAGSVKVSRQAYRALFTIISVIVMRTWIQVGMMTYIPFYYINFLKGNPVFAGKLVSVFLLGGAVGTIAGAPLADRWGHKFWLGLTMAGCALLFPLIFMLEGAALLSILFLFGVILISSFSVTIVMGQNLFPQNLGVASGLVAGFAIGAGGIGVTLLGLIADNFGVPFAMRCIGVLPVIGLVLTLMLKFSVERKTEDVLRKAVDGERKTELG